MQHSNESRMLYLVILTFESNEILKYAHLNEAFLRSNIFLGAVDVSGFRKRNWNTSRIWTLLRLRSKRFGKAFRTFNALFAFLAAGKLGRAQKKCVLRSPQFLRSQKAKNASNERKALRKRLLRRLDTSRSNVFPVNVTTSIYHLLNALWY